MNAISDFLSYSFAKCLENIVSLLKKYLLVLVDQGCVSLKQMHNFLSIHLKMRAQFNYDKVMLPIVYKRRFLIAKNSSNASTR